MSVIHQLALSFLPRVGDVTARTLLSYCGDAEEVFRTKKKQLQKIPGIGSLTADAILNHECFSRAEKELRFTEKYKIQILFCTDDRYPKRLKACNDAPVLLYYKGSADLNAAKVVSVVGTRKATEYGRDLCAMLMRDLKPHDPLIVSGLAYGIDGAAHKECLKNDLSTIGVLGHGLDRIYPAQHRQLAEKMLGQGGLLTEFPSETIPDRENFPKRNRIIAGMSDVTVVAEASRKGGALITAELANSYNRDVFAFPGRNYDEFSEGCNYLIKTNRANLISSVADLEYLLGWNISQANPLRTQLTMLLNLSEDEQKVADVLKEHGVTGVDEIAILTGLPQSRLAVTILEMEMQGYLIAMPGKTYKLA